LPVSADEFRLKSENTVRDMTATAAGERQIESYRRMTGEQRLAVALDLHELSCDVAREGIRRQHPGADAAEIERHLHDRLKLARAA
jgi:hypothetical protein